jgi:hypothetical protein
MNSNLANDILLGLVSHGELIHIQIDGAQSSMLSGTMCGRELLQYASKQLSSTSGLNIECDVLQDSLVSQLYLSFPSFFFHSL